MFRSLGEQHRTDAPFSYCFAQVVDDGDEQEVLRLPAQVLDGIEQVFRVHAESVLPRCRLKKLDPPGGEPHRTPTPPFARMGPTAGYAYESARTIQKFLESCQRLDTVGAADAKAACQKSVAEKKFTGVAKDGAVRSVGPWVRRAEEVFPSCAAGTARTCA